MDSVFNLYQLIRTWGIVIDILLFGLFIFLLIRAKMYVPRYFSVRTAPSNVVILKRAELLAAWSKIMDEFMAGNPQGRKLAIIDADKLIDTILKSAGIEGDTMMDRLEAAKSEGFISLDRVIRAHRLRNQIVHSHDFEPSFEEAENALAAYESFLKELKIL